MKTNTTTQRELTIRYAQKATGEEPPASGTIILGDCIDVMRGMPAASIDLIVTDPPYIANYCSRDGRIVPNDDNDRWLAPAFAQALRVLCPNRLCVSFYGWSKADRFLAAWRAVGFRPVGHLVFVKRYASKTRFVRYHHEQAYILAKGNPQLPAEPIDDVLRWEYTGNHLHPSQKPIGPLMQIIRAFSQDGDVVLDPFCGSGSTLVAASRLRRRFIGIDLNTTYHGVATARLSRSGSA